MHLRFRSVALLAFVAVPFALAQDPAATATAKAQCKFADGKDVTVEYTSPAMSGRKIFGGSVPFGAVWQTGANRPTRFVTSSNLTMGGKDVPAGSYTVFTIPAADKWTLILNKKTEGIGLPYKYESSELVRIDLDVRALPSPVENLTISFDQRFGGCVLNLRWEKTEASALLAEMK